ncbi:Uncharacterised protein [Streptococcus pneumoniae]|uniref:Uncharacterized protein n=1 Tax=Streptococcus pneumoniae TaxID=1313 RepID=A0A4M9X7L2_STREE|nr:Uncharacterised protein [Streptococcus pneumoniae]CIX83838.1 Uncharacterised protein [Streptococcus pneumoniae]CIY11894.1 Uncharacterised protein [Streptococcus pneumoniae]CIY33185.1 Uncharacterised protein [Streptococcus pneumoniae]CJA98411.1 Uncharacterised protein [Streptococcus pneumoniae]
MERKKLNIWTASSFFLFLPLSYLSCLSRLSYRYRAQVSTYT